MDVKHDFGCLIYLGCRCEVKSSLGLPAPHESVIRDTVDLDPSEELVGTVGGMPGIDAMKQGRAEEISYSEVEREAD